MGLYTLVFFGGTPIGAPLIGWAADRFGPRSGLVVGGLGTAVWTAVAFGLYWLSRSRDAAEPLPALDADHEKTSATDSRG
jgi:MFS family permease